MLDPDAVASRTFGTSFRGYDHDEVRRFLVEVAAELRTLASGLMDGIDDERASKLLGEEAGRLLAAARAAAADCEAKGQERAATVVQEAQEEATRLRAGVEAELERASTEGAARADEVLADAERARDEMLDAARSEAAQLVREAEDARELVLKDLARRRKELRVQVEQLQAAREELLRVVAEVGRISDEARGRLVVALPEAKVAADAAARRAEAEDEVTTEQLEAELEAFRLAGLSLPSAGLDEVDRTAAEVAEVAEGSEVQVAAVTDVAEVSEVQVAAVTDVAEVGEAAAPAPAPPSAADERPAATPGADPSSAREGRVSTSVRVFRASRGVVEPELHEVDVAAAFEEVRVVPVAEDERVEPGEVEVLDTDEVLSSTAPGGSEASLAGAHQSDDERVEPAGVEVLDEVPADDDAAPPAGDETAGGHQEAEAVAPSAARGEPERPDAEAVDALFARLRAGREERTAAAEAVLTGGDARAGTTASAPVREAPAAPVAEPAAAAATGEHEVPDPGDEPAAVEDVAVHVGGGPDRDALLARRDELLAAPVAALAKRLKRLLADEQNAVLDALRRSGASPDVVVAPDELSARWAADSLAELTAAAEAGAAFVDRAGAAPAGVDDVAAALAGATAAPLADRLAAAVRRADGDVDLAVDGVRSVCREWRSRRLTDGIDDAVHAAFGRGALSAVGGDGEHASLCWVVDDGGAPCPDAEDNALAGPVPAGEPFPTGHRHPPAHPGCRCVLAVAAVAAAGRP